MGTANITELYKHVSPDRLWQSILLNGEALISEVLPAASAAAGHSIEQALVVIDLKGFRSVVLSVHLSVSLLRCSSFNNVSSRSSLSTRPPPPPSRSAPY
jgi:hypothetical protein